MEPQLKKEIQEIFLWLKMSFHKENQKCESLTLIYDITLRESWSLKEFLKTLSNWDDLELLPIIFLFYLKN